MYAIFKIVFLNHKMGGMNKFSGFPSLSNVKRSNITELQPSQQEYKPSKKGLIFWIPQYCWSLVTRNLVTNSLIF